VTRRCKAEAIEPPALADIVRAAIKLRQDKDVRAQILAAEKHAKAVLRGMLGHIG
jgi:hypothetical protein